MNTIAIAGTERPEHAVARKVLHRRQDPNGTLASAFAWIRAKLDFRRSLWEYRHAALVGPHGSEFGLKRSWIPGTEAIRHVTGARAGLASTMTLPRWLAAGIGVILFVASVALALAGVPDAISGPGDVFSNLGRNLITTLAVALLAYVWFSFGTSYSATRRVRGEARRRPERLFPVPPGAGSPSNVYGRTRLVNQVATNLRDEFRTGPQVIIGETGSGKTTLLLALAAHFAQNNVYPIVLSLRDEEKIDFSDLAIKRFNEYVDPHVRTAGDVDKLWRWLCRRGEIVVLADDLDRANVPGMAADPYKTAARVALQAASRRRLPLVVASRPEALPPDLNVTPVDIGPLELDADAATDELLTRAGRGKKDPEREKIREYIKNGDLTANPFYLGLLAEVLRLPSPPKPAADHGEHGVRLALLDCWREGLLDKKIVHKGERRRRKRILDRVEDFAVARLIPDRDGWKGDPAGAEREWLSDLHAAERLKVVEMDAGGSHRFRHDVLHAYFASGKRATLLNALASAPDAPRVQLSVVFAAASGRDRSFCRKACKLLAGSGPKADERRLLRAAAAAEVARAGDFHELDERIAETCADARRGASPLIRRAALEQVAKLHGEGVVEALWKFAGDDDYDVRWAAAQQLIERCSTESPSSRGGDGDAMCVGPQAYKVLVPIFEKCLKTADKVRGADDRRREILALKHMAWILPALRAPAKGWRDRDLEAPSPDELLERLIDLETKRVSSERGLEASIAQGYKVDALALITTPKFGEETLNIDKEKELLSRAKFWYSQLNLLHAITLRVAYRVAQWGPVPNTENGRVTLLERSTHKGDTILGRSAYVRDATRGRSTYIRDLLNEEDREEDRKGEDRHPYVCAAAALCDRALDEVTREVEHLPKDEETRRRNAARQALGRYVWGDEGVLVSQEPAELDKGEVAQARLARSDGGNGTSRSFGLVDSAIQLVGDIVVLLNLNEIGGEHQRQEFAERAELPYCMSQSHDRSELFGTCECAFGLCPYQPAINLPSAHREISRGFCRHQQHHATSHAARRWGSKVRRRELREFWEKLESKAQM